MTVEHKPDWLQKRVSVASQQKMRLLLGELDLSTVCQQALCPNVSECFGHGQATFLILGSNCTRRCSFCNMKKVPPLPPDPAEADRVAEAVRRLNLNHVVITSPTRDDLPDGGASFFAKTVDAVRTLSPTTRIELLIPDLQGNREHLAIILAADPSVIGHNVETVPRLYHVRSGADYRRSLDVLRNCRQMAPDIRTKSGIMVGLGETRDELLQVFHDLRGVGCDYLTIGQYLAPGSLHYQVQEYIPPAAFVELQVTAESFGFLHVESGPYVRSSYHAGRYA